MFKKWACLGVIGFVLPSMGGCPCCGTASCCENPKGSSFVEVPAWMQRVEPERSTELPGPLPERRLNTQ